MRKKSKTYQKMKVLKHGTTTKYVAVCPHCGCEFEFLETEAITGWSPKELYVHCPECHDVVREVHFKEAE